MKSYGFTFVELIVVILLIGIISIFVAPRFFGDDEYKARGISDEIITSIRHAQRLAMTRGDQYKIDIDPNSYQVRRTNNDAVRHPSGRSPFLFQVPADFPANIIQSTVTIEFDTLGRPVDNTGAPINNNIDIIVSPFTIRVEEETGYARIL